MVTIHMYQFGMHSTRDQSTQQFRKNKSIFDWTRVPPAVERSVLTPTSGRQCKQSFWRQNDLFIIFLTKPKWSMVRFHSMTPIVRIYQSTIEMQMIWKTPDSLFNLQIYTYLSPMKCISAILLLIQNEREMNQFYLHGNHN